jgi:hypothetical protein
MLITFGICCLLFFKELGSTYREHFCFRGQMRSERSFRNKLQTRLFISQMPKLPAQLSSSSKKVYKNIREFYRTYELSKLNLSPLLDGPKDPSFPRLRETTATLLRLLYRHLALEKKYPEWEYRLIDSWVQKKEVKSFSDLFPEDKELSFLFYQLLKGTHVYDLQQKKGIPPLTDFMRLSDSKNDKAIHFAFSSQILLSSLLGDHIAERIVQEEKKKWEKENKRLTLKKEELEQILLESAQENQNLSILLPLLSFSTKVKRSHHITASDKDSEIQFTRKIVTIQVAPQAGPE